MILNIFWLMRNDDHRPIATFFEKFFLAFFMKTRIPNCNDFVDQEAIELDRH